MKKTTAVIISVLLVISLSLICLADDDGYIKNVNLAPDGTLSWDKYDGAEEYWLGVNGNFERFDNGSSISERISAPGIYKLVLEGYTEGGEFMMAEWQCVVEYDGTVFNIYAEQAIDTTADTTVDQTERTMEETEEMTTEETETETETQLVISDADTAAGIDTETETTEFVSDTTGAETDTEVETPSNKNATKFIIAGICIVIAAAAAAAVVIVRKRSGDK